jgi:co-chaperonin GroES (HSP10)
VRGVSLYPILPITIPPQTARVLEKGIDVSEDIELDRLAIIPQWAGTEVKVQGDWYLLLPEEEIMGYVID